MCREAEMGSMREESRESAERQVVETEERRRIRDARGVVEEGEEV